MKTVNAIWEQRNMGVDCTEITIEKSDKPEESIEIISNVQSDYVVVRVPVPMIQMCFALEDAGFRYIETMFSLRRTTEIPDLTPHHRKLVDSTDYTPMGPDDHLRLFEEIRAGMYKTDRVSLDPAFSREQACERYVGWISDEIARGTELFKFTYREDDAGFFALKKVREGVYLPFLAGIYPGGPKVLGLGYALCYLEIVEANRRGARTITGSVSSNNMPSLSVLTSFGYSTDGASTVFIKHR